MMNEITDEADLKRKLRLLSAELERGTVRPARIGGRHGLKLRSAAAGIGMAICIAAALAIFSQLIPTKAERDAAAREKFLRAHPQQVEPVEPSSDARPVSEPRCFPNRGDRLEPSPGDAVSASITPTTVSLGGTATFSASWTNKTDRTYSGQWQNPRVRYVVTSADHRIVYDSTAGQSFSTELHAESAPPGAVVRDSLQWRLRGCPDEQGRTQSLAPGKYFLVAVWSGFGVSPPVPFTIR